jgi:SAM-dependent methyltransferase
VAQQGKAGIRGEMSRLYDVFVDWPGRLAREMPGIERELNATGAKRVLDAGCGTGRHVQALLERGFDAHGADVSDEMLAKARELLGGGERLHAWRMGEAPPATLRDASPFDAVICMGNVWPQLSASGDALRAAQAFRELLRPRGLLLVGLKALAVRREDKLKYLPLLKRRHEGRALFFARFLDFDVPQPASGELVCDLHMTISAGEPGEELEALHHGASRVRAWTPEELARFFAGAGFAEVDVRARLGEPHSAPTGEDVFVSARSA